MNMSMSEPHPRLSISTPSRLVLGSVSSGIVGLTLGAMQGGQMAQLRFRAEHAHKMPDTTTGWYFYHKSKNYHAMQGGIREGFRMGAKTGFWSFVALGLESTVDRYRGSSDMFSTIVATLSVAGAFSLWRECSTPHPRRTPHPPSGSPHDVCRGTVGALSGHDVSGHDVSRLERCQCWGLLRLDQASMARLGCLLPMWGQIC